MKELKEEPLLIEATWKDYFENPDEGLGTTYERFVLHGFFERMRKEYSIRSVLEAPSFGMTGISGINSLWWATQGIPVTVMDHNPGRLMCIEKVWKELHLQGRWVFSEDYDSVPFEKETFDLSWNFSALSPIQDIDGFLGEFTRVTRKVIFICIPNKNGLSPLVRLALRKNTLHESTEKHIQTESLIASMGKLKWQTREQGYLDVPPWPDIAMKKEDFLKALRLKRLAKAFEKRNGEGISILDYFSGKRTDLDKKVLKYSFLENSPKIFKRFWAHHQYFIFVPK
jgi:hypothetical protein